MSWSRLALALALATTSCGVEKLPPSRVVHRGNGAQPGRVIVLPPECDAPWCRGAAELVSSELAFRGIDVVDLARLAAVERTRTVVQISESRASLLSPTALSTQTQVTLVGPMLSDADLWTQRARVSQLGVDAVVRVRAAKLSTWPVRAFAIIRVTRVADAGLIVASACQAELSRLDSDAEMMDRALRCALAGIAP